MIIILGVILEPSVLIALQEDELYVEAFLVSCYAGMVITLMVKAILVKDFVQY
jgi:hypothetical protein